MEPTDLTIEILKGIRDEIRGTNERIESTNVRLGETNARLEALGDDTRERLDGLARRQVDTETRLATEVVAVATAVREVRDLLREDRARAAQIDDHERRLRAIEARAP